MQMKVYESLENQDKYRTIQQLPNETIAQTLQREGYATTIPCGGNGTCGKCKVLVLQGETSLTEEEKQLLSKECIKKGERLMCRAKFLTDGAICLLTNQKLIGEEQIQSVGITAKTTMNAQSTSTTTEWNAGNFCVAVDIGTTTIAMALVDRKTGNIAASLTKNNSQRQYGADVISRIKCANEGVASQLKSLIWKDITDGLDQLLEEDLRNDTGELVISANTTMEHLLMGDSCLTLGEAPFLPADISLRTRTMGEIAEETPQRYHDMMVTVLPGISAFVGADIVSGMYDCGLHTTDKPVLFIDLGTNGEMVLGTKRSFVATSTAVGPAFEGGNITYGCPGIAGAISSVSMMGSHVVTHTIANKKPIGICGTGVLELTFELYKAGIMDEQGNLRQLYLENGYSVAQMENGDRIIYTQADIRQLQMAKSAIRSGIELLMRESNITAQEISKVFLAGGFGYKLNVYKAAGIGLIPRELREKTVAGGNASLQGAIRFLMEKGAAESMRQLILKTKEMNLAAHPTFEKYYLKYMNFDV